MAAGAYARDWPAGPSGYTNSARRNATVLQPAVPTLQSEADLSQPSRTTLRRWHAQIAATGNCDRRGPAGGRPLKLSATGAYLLWFFKTHYPAAYYTECAEWLELTHGEEITQSQWSRELARLGFTRKKLEWLSRQRDEAQRCEWWCAPPDPAAAVVVSSDSTTVSSSTWTKSACGSTGSTAPLGTALKATERSCETPS